MLFNQSYHMTDMYVEGPDALKLLSALGINSFKGFEADKAKQYVPCNYDGYVIGDVVLFYLGKNCFQSRRTSVGSQLGAVPLRHGRLQREVRARRACRRAAGADRAQGVSLPGAGSERDEGRAEGDSAAPAPDIKFFNMTSMKIAGQRGTRAASRHGGTAGLRTVRTLGRRRGGEGRDCRSGPGVRPAPGRCPRLFVEYARVRLDSFADAGDLLGREDEGVSPVAARDEL